MTKVTELGHCSVETTLGVVARKMFNEMPPHVEYSLTEYGQTLRPLLRALCDSGSKHEAYVARNGAQVLSKSPANSEPRRIVPAIG